MPACHHPEALMQTRHLLPMASSISFLIAPNTATIHCTTTISRFTSPTSNGRWSAPQRFDVINSDSSEYYISFARNGNLYFASSRKGGYGEEDIYISRLVDNRYTEPVNLGPAINTERSEYDPCISGNEDLMIFTSANRADTYGKGDLYAALQGDNTWLAASNLGSAFNTPTRDYCAYFSPDNVWFFFSSQKDVKWVRADFVTKHIRK